MFTNNYLFWISTWGGLLSIFHLRRCNMKHCNQKIFDLESELNRTKLHDKGLHISFENDLVTIRKWPYHNLRTKTTFSSYPILFMPFEIDVLQISHFKHRISKAEVNRILKRLNTVHSPLSVFLFGFAWMTTFGLILETIDYTNTTHPYLLIFFAIILSIGLSYHYMNKRDKIAQSIVNEENNDTLHPRGLSLEKGYASILPYFSVNLTMNQRIPEHAFPLDVADNIELGPSPTGILTENLIA
eukprot:TRINITY_DN4306_c0_g1_i2.p1 TRINITY_DN4306_c0_g1~~TRINITY_DN4306_c0_g1_i2.p1  ORF type:complete len:243 (+),score=2.10 TRINITY_DN4306_c0_g1_i2:87-815(+)